MSTRTTTVQDPGAGPEDEEQSLETEPKAPDETGSLLLLPSWERQENAGRIAWSLLRRSSTGIQIAELRRMDPERHSTHYFWDIAYEFWLAAAPAEALTAWARIIKQIAKDTKVQGRTTAAKQTGTGPHDGHTALGDALARAKYSEARLNSLLNAQGRSIPDKVAHMTAFLKLHQQRFNWNQAAALMLTDFRSTEQRRADRIRIARNYHITVRRNRQQ